jgi:hypothetical protein
MRITHAANNLRDAHTIECSMSIYVDMKNAESLRDGHHAEGLAPEVHLQIEKCNDKIDQQICLETSLNFYDTLTLSAKVEVTNKEPMGTVASFN